MQWWTVITDTRIMNPTRANWGVHNMHKNIPLILVLMGIVAVFLLDQWGYFAHAATPPTKEMRLVTTTKTCKQIWGCYGVPGSLTGGRTAP